MTIESVLLIVLVLISSAGLIVQFVLSSGRKSDRGVNEALRISDSEMRSYRVPL